LQGKRLNAETHLKIRQIASIGALACALAVAANRVRGDEPPLPPTPPQDQGLPYTRTSHAQALAQLATCIAVYPGSRIAYDRGLRIRLDEKSWHDEAVLRKGVVYVPAGFASVLAAKRVNADAPPDYLAYRWVYTIDRPAATVPAGVGTIDVDGQAYIDLAAAAKAMELVAYPHPRGFVLIGNPPPKLDHVDAPHLDAIVTLFDTPEKFADPDIATRYVPTLKRQGKWTDHVKVSDAQLSLVNGPETQWPTAPQSDYDYTGFNQTLLGSAVPPPGVYPRVLFSPQDVPMLAKRLKSTKAGQMALIEMEYLFKKSWWDPKTSDGQIFQKLASGDTRGLDFDVPAGTSPTSWPQVFKGEKPGIFNTHIAYVPECLTAMSLYCLLNNDDQHGRMAAAAIANWYKLREPLLDEVNNISDSEFGGTYTRPNGDVVQMDGNGSETTWRTQAALVAHMNLGLSLDFSGKWMTAQEKDTMRRIIAKATYGRRAYGQDGSIRFRDVNWVAWDLPDFLAVTAIEGLPGFDREVYESNCETVRAFCDWGIDKSGVIYESNGKTPGSLQFETLSMVALARRGENLFGHPHWRKLLTGQIQMTSPDGRVTVNSGTQYTPFSQSWLSLQMVDEEKAFFPDDRRPDYLLERAKQYGGKRDESMREWVLDDFNADQYRNQVADLKRLRLPSPTYPGFVHGMLYDADFVPTTRADLKMPLDFDAPVHGVFSSYSDDTPDATWIDMMVRPDIYLGAGHHHADAGQVHFSALGVDWFTQTQLNQNYDGKLFTLVRVDGHSDAESDPQVASGYIAAPKYLGANSSDQGGFASADLTNAYSYRWMTQPQQVWSEKSDKLGWEMDPSSDIAKIFAGTARYKMRPWWASYTYVNYMATSRAVWNPMQYVYRSAGLVRGKHPLGLVVDDAKKDDRDHLYQWAAMLNGPVWEATIPDVPDGAKVLGLEKGASDQKAIGTADKKPLIPQQGDPMLLVYPVGLEAPAADSPLMEVGVEPGPPDRKGVVSNYDRLLINHRGHEAHFKVLLIPFHAGEAMPKVSYDRAADKASVDWSDESDQLSFAAGSDGRCKVTVARAGQTIVQSK
jgi:hypothetical protein